jgi:S-formylglutathione hydrolase FrmB
MQISLFCLIFSSSSYALSGQIVNDSFYSPALSKNIPLKIYLPPNHSSTGDPYRVYIFLHGGGNSNYSTHVSTIQQPLDQLINNPVLEFTPLVVVFANIQWPGLGGGIYSYNAHYYTNSARNGNYESVISNDLCNWIDTCSYNLSIERDKMAIGGFSMGGGSSIRLALHNIDKFSTVVSHCGIPAFNVFRYWLQYLLIETPIVGNQYNFHPGNSFESTWWFCASAAWSPNLVNPNQPLWNLDFPVNPNDGYLIPAIFDSFWFANFDAVTLIHNPLVYTDSLHIYFDTRPGDGNKRSNDIFHDELINIGHEHVYNVFSSGGHEMLTDAARNGLMFIDSVMDRSLTKIIEEEYIASVARYELKQNYPNPFNPRTNIQFSIPKTKFVTLKVYNILGEEVATLVSERLSAGSYSYEWDAGNHASGVYMYRLQAGDYVEILKMILIN